MSGQDVKRKSCRKLMYVGIAIVVILSISLVVFFLTVSHCKRIAGTSDGINNPVVNSLEQWGIIKPSDILSGALLEHNNILPVKDYDVEIVLENDYTVTDDLLMSRVYSVMLDLDSGIPITTLPITKNAGVTVTLSTTDSKDTFYNTYIYSVPFGDEIRDSLIGKSVGDVYNVEVLLPNNTTNVVNVSIDSATVDLEDHLTDEWVANNTPTEYGQTVEEFIAYIRSEVEYEQEYFKRNEACTIYINNLYNYVEDVLVSDNVLDVYVQMLKNSGVIVTDDFNALASIYAKEDILYLDLYSKYCNITPEEFNDIFKFSS